MKNKWARIAVGSLVFISPVFFQTHFVWLIVSGLMGLNILLTGSFVPCPMCSVMNIVKAIGDKLSQKS